MALVVDLQLLMQVMEVIATFAVAWLMNRYIVDPATHHHFRNIELHTRLIIARVARIVIYIIALIVALSLLELTGPAMTLLGSLGIASVVIAFAVKDFVADYLSGFTIYSEKLFKIGDFVEVAGYFGVVKDVTSRTTRLETRDGELITIPNSVIRTKIIKNRTITGPLLRSRVPVSISYESDTRKAVDICMDVMKKTPAVLHDPKPEVLIMKYAESSVSLELRYWVNVKKHLRVRVRSDMLIRLKQEFNKKGIKIPYPHIEIVKGK